MSEILATVVVPTLANDPALLQCVASLQRQSFRGFEIVVVDNSGAGQARGLGIDSTVIEMGRNAGFGAAVNAGFRASRAPFVATLNDDAVAHPDWLRALIDVIHDRPDIGMCASQVRLFGEDRLDSAGMLLCRDGSSKQRGHLRPPVRYPHIEDVLLPSGSAALYRRAMLDQIGMFDEDFFLYCEDTDLGLRARWAGWRCLYVPNAVVEHRYSHSAGRVSPLKAYYVERNRQFVAIKNFPMPMLLASPFVAAARYGWHLLFILLGKGSAARFTKEGHGGIRLIWFVVKAHVAALANLRSLCRKRRETLAKARISSREFRGLARAARIGARQVAEL